MPLSMYSTKKHKKFRRREQSQAETSCHVRVCGHCTSLFDGRLADTFGATCRRLIPEWSRPSRICGWKCLHVVASGGGKSGSSRYIHHRSDARANFASSKSKGFRSTINSTWSGQTVATSLGGGEFHSRMNSNRNQI